MTTVFERNRENVIAGQSRRILVKAIGDNKSRVVEQYIISAQYPGVSANIVLDRKAVHNLIQDLMVAINDMDRHQNREEKRNDKD